MESSANSRSNAEDPVADLLARFQENGEPQLLDELLRVEIATLKERIRRRYGHMLTPTRSASDVAQDAAAGFVKVARRTSFENPIAFRAYLLRCAFRLLSRHAQRRNARPGVSSSDAEGAPEVASTGPSPEDKAVSGSEATTLRLALATLPKDQREILERVYLREMPIKDAAADLSLDVETAYKRVQRGRVALAERLAAWTRVLD